MSNLDKKTQKIIWKNYLEIIVPQIARAADQADMWEGKIKENSNRKGDYTEEQEALLDELHESWNRKVDRRSELLSAAEAVHRSIFPRKRPMFAVGHHIAWSYAAQTCSACHLRNDYDYETIAKEIIATGVLEPYITTPTDNI